MSRKVTTVSVAEFADMVGKTTRRVHQWIQEGMPHRRRGGVSAIVVKEGVQWIIEHETRQRKQRDKAKSIDAEHEKALTQRAVRLLKENELLEKTRQLVPVVELREFIERVFGTFSGVAAGRLQSFERDYNLPPAAARALSQRIHRELMAGALAYAEQLDTDAAERERADKLRAPALPDLDDDDDDSDSIA